MDFYALNLLGTHNHTTATHDDAEASYKLLQGAFPTDLEGYGYFTSWDRAAGDKEAARGETVLASSFISSPGRVFRLELGTGDATHPVRGSLKTLNNAAWYLREMAPHLFIRDDVAEMSVFGISNLSNVAPMPFGPVADGYRMIVGCDPVIPTEISPRTLTVHGPVGHRREWTPFLDGTLLPMTMTSGHPFFDPNDGPTGTVYMPDLLVRPPISPWSRVGAYPRLRTWTGSGAVGGPFYLVSNGKLVFFEEASAHQVGTTRDYVLLAQTNVSFGLASLILPFLARLTHALSPAAVDEVVAWVQKHLAESTQLPFTRLLIIRKADLREAALKKRDKVPCREVKWEWETSHFLCDYDNPNGQLTVFAQLSIGFDAGKSIQTGEALLSGRTVSPHLNQVFGAATDLQVAARYDIDANQAAITRSILTPSQDPDDPRFLLGVMTQIPTAPLYYRPLGAEAFDINGIGRAWSHTFWCSTGWMPSMESEEIFAIYREARVTEPLQQGKPPQRYIPEERFLKRSQDPANTATLWRLDREMQLDLKRDVWKWPAGWVASAPFFAPRAGATSMEDGYLISLVSPPVAGASMEVWIFDAGRPLAEGPVCTLTPDAELPLRIGYPLHSTWMDRAAVDGWQPPAYKVPLVEPHRVLSLLDVGFIATSYACSVLRSRLVELRNCFM